MKKVKNTTVAVACLAALLGVIHPATGWTKSVEGKVKDWIDEGSDAFKRGVDKLGDDFHAIQDYLDQYSWKDMIQEDATSGIFALRNLELNGHSRAVVAKPGEKIEAEVTCDLDSEKASMLGVYRIVVGIKGEGAQTVIGNELGVAARKTREKFTLKAPEQPGIYQIRFRTLDAFLKKTALESWKDKEGNEPDAKTTIGVIIVK